MLHYLQFLFCDCDVVTVSYRLPRLLKLNPPPRQRRVKDACEDGRAQPVQILGEFLLFLAGVKQIHESFSLFCLPPCPTSGSRLSEVSFQKAPSNAAKECSLICPELFRTQLVFFFPPKNQFWVSRFVEASVCRVLCECVNLVTNY